MQKVLQQIPTPDGTLVESEAPRLCPRIRYKIGPILVGPVPGKGLNARKFRDSLQVGLSKSGGFNHFAHQGDCKFSRLSNTKEDMTWQEGKRYIGQKGEAKEYGKSRVSCGGRNPGSSSMSLRIEISKGVILTSFGLCSLSQVLRKKRRRKENATTYS